MAKCEECDGHCCKYITIQIDAPNEDIDFEEIKWWLCHENVLVYLDHDGDWCVEVKTPCKHQDPKTNLCLNYNNRPKVCSDHQTHECEANEDYDDYYQIALRTPEDVDAYKKLKFGNKKQKLQKGSNGETEDSDKSSD